MNGLNANNSISAVYPDFNENAKAGVADLLSLGNGLYRFGLTNIYDLRNVTGMELQCVENRSKRGYEVTFVKPANWADYTDIGIKIRIKRDDEWNVNTFHDFTNFFSYGYDVIAKGEPTIQNIRDGVYDMIVNYQADGRGAVLFDVVKSGTTKLLIFAKTSDFDFSISAWNGAHTVATISQNEPGVWFGNDWKRFRGIPSLYPGEGLPDYLMYCKSPCLITLQNCVQSCSNDEAEQLLAATRSWKGTIHVWVDGSHANFEAFVNSIKAAIPVAATVQYNGCPGNPVISTQSNHLLVKSTGFSNSKMVVTGLPTTYTVLRADNVATDTYLLASTYTDFKIKTTAITALADDAILTFTYSYETGQACETRVFKWNKVVGFLSD